MRYRRDHHLGTSSDHHRVDNDPCLYRSTLSLLNLPPTNTHTEHTTPQHPPAMLLQTLTRTPVLLRQSAAPALTRACSICAARSLLPTYGKTIIPCPSPISTSPSFSGSGSSISRPRIAASALDTGVDRAVRGMKVRSSVKKFCDGCSVVRRKGYLYVVCSKDPKHKQASLPSSGRVSYYIVGRG